MLIFSWLSNALEHCYQVYATALQGLHVYMTISMASLEFCSEDLAVT